MNMRILPALLATVVVIFTIVSNAYSQKKAVVTTPREAVFTPSAMPLQTPAPAPQLSAKLDRIRVRIFPHRYSYAPHLADTVKNSFRLVSSTPCSVFEAHPDLPVKTDHLITRTETLKLTAAKLKTALWVVCDTPVMLERSVGLESYRYSGAIYIKSVIDPDTKSKVLVAINELPLEDYLRGVVPAEIMPSWHMETLKSQAIAARTYAIFHMIYARKTARHRDFDVDDSVVFQVYTGVQKINARTDLAVHETTGEILMQDDRVIQAYYHSDSGGFTASADKSFNLDAPYCVGKKEPYDLSLVTSEWSKRVSLNDINQRLAERGFVSLENPVMRLQIAPLDRAESGRVNGLQLYLRDGSMSYLPATKFRQSIALNSLMFSVRSLADANGTLSYEVNGRGLGHGVGMNQMGAKILAQNYGWNYQRILNFYYTGVHICSLQKDPSNNKIPACSKDSDWASN